MKHNRILLTSILALSTLLVGCGKKDITSSNPTSSKDVNPSYKEIEDIAKYIKTYDSKADFNFEAKYSCSVVYNRSFYTSWNTDYQYMNGKIQLTYETDDSYFTDYYHEDVEKDIYVYYIDMGGAKEYQTISNGSDFFFQYYSAIDEINISNVDWEENFLVDEKDKKLIPCDDSALKAMGQKIFGEKQGEYWEKLEISYDNNYISEISAISIYMEATYYFNIKFENQGWVNFDLPQTTQEYVGNQPYYKNEEYLGIALTNEQKEAIEIFDNAVDNNYAVNTKWEQVNLDKLTGNSFVTNTVYADGNAQYSWTNVQTNLTSIDYLIYDKITGQNTYYYDDGAGNYAPAVQGSQDFQDHIGNFALDQLNLANLKAEDFIYNENKGYIMPKDKATEKTLVGGMFGYADNYFGLHIYLNKDNVISKIETSIFVEENDNILSYKKTYTISEIKTARIHYPDTVSH